MAEKVAKENSFSENYILGRQLGHGCYGYVYECSELASERRYAVKIVSKRCKKLKETSMEVVILKLVQHPNILQLHATQETDNELYIITELLEGGALIDFLSEKEYFTERDAGAYVHQILSAVSYLHDKQIVHQDIKPDNILLTNKQLLRVKLIDFGIAKLCSEKLEFLSVEGTAVYSPPEVLNYDVTDCSRDMWAMGVCTYVLLSGYFPFEGDTEGDVMQEILKVNFTFTQEFEGLSKEAIDFINNLLRKERKKRMTAEVALKHKWLSCVDNIHENKIDTREMKRFKAKMRWKSSIRALTAVISVKQYVCEEKM